MLILKEAAPDSNWLGHTQKAGPYSKSCTILEYGAAGWVILKIWEFQNVPKYFRIHYMHVNFSFRMEKVRVYVTQNARFPLDGLTVD